MIIQLMTYTICNYLVTSNFLQFAKFGGFENQGNQKALEVTLKQILTDVVLLIESRS